MYVFPHEKLADRTYSSKPEIGIPIALEVLSDPESHTHDVMSASCHLVYRVLDGQYSNIEFVKEKLDLALKLANEMAPEEPAWIKTRWRVSLSLAYAYFEVLVLKNPLPREVLNKCVTEEHVCNHPLQTVNVMRAQLLLCADELFKLGKVDPQVCHELVEKYSVHAVNLYRLASQRYTLMAHRESNYVYCFSESMECLNEIIKLKYCYNKETENPPEKIAQDLRKLFGDRTKAAYRETLVAIYEKNKDARKSRIIQPMHIVFDIKDKKVAFCNVAKCATRTVVGWSSLVKNPNLYQERPDLFASERMDLYQELRNMISPLSSKEILDCEIFFTIVRDPIERFISAYTNRILYLNTAGIKFSIEEFIRNYDYYSSDRKYRDIIHHTQPITYFCGTDPSIFTHIFNITQLDQVKELLEDTYKVKLPDIRLNKSDDTNPIKLSNSDVKKIKIRYKQDYEIYGKWFP